MTQAIKQWEQRESNLEDEIRSLNEELHKVRDQLAGMQTDLKVGDLVLYNGEKWVIVAIKPGYGKEPKIMGKKVKKNGLPGTLVREMWRSSYGAPIKKITS